MIIMKMRKYYYENLLSNQNVTAKTNVVWVADMTTLKLFNEQNIQVFLCIDLHTNLYFVTPTSLVKIENKAAEFIPVLGPTLDFPKKVKKVTEMTDPIYI